MEQTDFFRFLKFNYIDYIYIIYLFNKCTFTHEKSNLFETYIYMYHIYIYIPYDDIFYYLSLP